MVIYLVIFIARNVFQFRCSLGETQKIPEFYNSVARTLSSAKLRPPLDYLQFGVPVKKVFSVYFL